MPKKNPIFVIGCLRSGKTLAAAILNKHPELFILFETNVFSGLYRKWIYLCRVNKGLPREHFISVITKNFFEYNKRFGISVQDIIDCAYKGPPNWGEMLNRYMHLLMARAKPTAMRWGDKTPHHIANIEQISQEYPDSQFIYIYRDPRSVAAAMSRADYPHTTNSYLINAEVVRQYLSLYQEQKFKAKEANILEIQYENLVYEPRHVVKNICNFLQVDYKDNLLNQAGEKIRDIIGWPNDKAWNRIEPQSADILPERISPFVEAYLSNWIEHFGYKKRKVTFPRLRKMIVEIRVFIFRGMRALLAFFWNRMYPGFPFIMLKYPSFSNYVHWLFYSKNFKRSRLDRELKNVRQG